jgi:peptidoglycan/xylan/chitin deacetylase (PgdA/CDA1 family)
MLNARNINLLSGLLAGITLILQWLTGKGIWILLAIGIFWVAMQVYGSIRIQADFYLPSVNRLPGADRTVALTFDDGPAGEQTARILDILLAEGVKASFFCIGSRIEGQEALLQRIHHDGHLVGNHSHSHHFWFDLFSADRMAADLRQMSGLCAAVIGASPRYIRPPYGVTNPNLAKAIRALGGTSIGWTVRSLDTVARKQDRLLRQLQRGIQPGAIFLLHDTAPLTPDILQDFIHSVRKQGFEFVRLDHFIKESPYA